MIIESAMFIGTFWMYISWAFAVAIFVLFAAWKKSSNLLNTETKRNSELLEKNEKLLLELLNKQESFFKSLNKLYKEAKHPQESEEDSCDTLSEDELDALAILKHIKNVKERAAKKIDKL